MQVTVHHDAEARRFTADVDGFLCQLDYTLCGAVMTITHTDVPREVGGRGIAAALTTKAMETARDRNWKVNPVCAYAAAWMRRHPEWDSLRA